mgnify:CR=1 FL=1
MTSLNVLRVTNLTRQVTAAHLREVFGHFGDVARVDLAVDATVGLSRGYAVVELASRADAEAAKAALDGGRLDGPAAAAKHTVATERQASRACRKKASSPARVAAVVAGCGPLIRIVTECTVGCQQSKI